MQHQGGLLTQVIKYRGRGIKKQRQVILDARRGHAVAHVLVDAAARGVALQQLAPALAELGAARLVHGELAPWQQAHFRHGVQAALRVGVKRADGVDLVVEQIHPVRHGAAHRVQVNQPTAHRVFAWADHLRHVGVAGQCELRFQRRLVQLLALLEVKGCARHERRWRQPNQRRGGRHQHHIGRTLLDGPQRGQPLADQILVRAEGVVGQRLPVREQHAAQAGLKKRQLVQQALRIGSVGAGDGRQPLLATFAPRQLRQQQGIGRAGRARQGVAFTGGELGQVHGSRQQQKTTKPPGQVGRGVKVLILENPRAGRGRPMVDAASAKCVGAARARGVFRLGWVCGAQRACTDIGAKCGSCASVSSASSY